MNIRISKAFMKDSDVLPKRIKHIILELLEEIQNTNTKLPHDIKDCDKLKCQNSLYRVRKGVYRITFEFEDNLAVLKRVIPRGQAYKKHNV